MLPGDLLRRTSDYTRLKAVPSGITWLTSTSSSLSTQPERSVWAQPGLRAHDGHWGNHRCLHGLLRTDPLLEALLLFLLSLLLELSPLSSTFSFIVKPKARKQAKKCVMWSRRNNIFMWIYFPPTVIRSFPLTRRVAWWNWIKTNEPVLCVCSFWSRMTEHYIYSLTYCFDELWPLGVPVVTSSDMKSPSAVSLNECAMHTAMGWQDTTVHTVNSQSIVYYIHFQTMQLSPPTAHIICFPPDYYTTSQPCNLL